MDQGQFTAFLDKLTEISRSIEQLLDKQDELKDATSGKDNRPGLFGRDKSPSKLSSKEKKVEAEKGSIYAKEFMKLFEGMDDDRKKNENKVNEMFKKNLIKVSLEWVGRRAIDQLKSVLNDGALKDVKKRSAGAAAAGAGAGGLLGGLAGGLGGALGALNSLIPLIMAIGGIAAILVLVKNIDKVGEFVKSVLPSLGDFLVKILPVAADNILKIIQGVLPVLKTLLEYLKEMFFKVLDSLPGILKAVSGAVMPIITTIFDYLKTLDLPGILKAAFDGIKGILEILAAQIPVLIPPVLKLAGAVKDIIMSLIGSIPDIFIGVKKVINAITLFVKQAIPALGDFLQRVFNFITDMAPYIKDIAFKYLDTIKTIVLAMIPHVKDIIAIVVNGITFLAPFLQTVLLKAIGAIQGIVLKLFDTIKDVAPYFTKQVGYLKDAIVALAKPLDTLIDKLGDVLIKILESVKEGIISTRENLKTLAGMVRGVNIVDYFKLAAGITALGVAVAAFGVTVGAGSMFSSIGKNPIDKILDLAKNEEKIYTVASSLDMLGRVIKETTSISAGDKFYAEMKKVSEGLALLTNVDKIENLDKLQNLSRIKEAFGTNTESVNVKMSEIDKAESAQLFSGIYTVTGKVNDKMDSINDVLSELNGKFSQMIVLQNKQASYAAESADHLEGINSKESTGGNVTVASSSQNIIFNEKSTSQFDFRREMALRFAHSAIT